MQGEIVTLTKSIESIFRQIIRFLIGKITCAKLLELVRRIYIEEAENHLRQLNPNKSVSLSALAVLTGLDTRALKKIKNSKSYRRPVDAKSQFFENLSPEFRLIERWTSDPNYLDLGKGVPKILSIRGPLPSFETLFLEDQVSRGITVNSMIEHLRSSGSVKIDEKANLVELVDRIYIPSPEDSIESYVEVAFTAISRMISTIFRNLEKVPQGLSPFIERASWTTKLKQENLEKCRDMLTEYVSEADEEVQKIMESMEEGVEKQDHYTVGVGFYYFENEPNS